MPSGSSPHYSPMLEKDRHTVSSLRGEPFAAALNGPVPCRPPPDPLQGCLFLLSGPERNRKVSDERGLHGSPLGWGGEKPSATKADAPGTNGVKEQGDI